MGRVAVIILNYKLKELTLNCLQSVLRSDYKEIVPIVVDNNSDDQIEKDLQRFKDIEFIQTGENLGYAGGNNVGIKKAMELGTDFIFVLNPDTKIFKDTITNLVDKAERYGDGIYGPKIYFREQNLIWFAGGKLDKANVLGSHRGVNEKDEGQYDKDLEVDFVTGAAMFATLEVFKKVGLLDERYFLYYEDCDFCYRAREKGFKIWYVYNAKVYHDNAKSTGLGSPLQDYYITRNRMLFASKFLKLRTQFALFREALANFKVKARRKALTDFVLKRFGKRYL